MKKYPGLLILLLLIVMAAGGCTQATTGGSGGTVSNGSLVVYVTDAPPSHDVTSIIVTVASVKVHAAGTGENTTVPSSDNASDNETFPAMTTVNGSGSGAGGQWLDIPLSGNVTFDLLQLQGVTAYLGAANLTPGTYTQIRLEISSVKVGLNGGEPQDATLPSGVLKVVRPFQIASDMSTSLTFDFNADKMVTVTGNGGIIVKPVVKVSVSPPGPSVSGQTMIPANPPTPTNP